MLFFFNDGDLNFESLLADLTNIYNHNLGRKIQQKYITQSDKNSIK